MPKVSFILPVIRTQFLGLALDYIHNQTLKDWDMVIINNTAGNKITSEDKRIKVIEPDHPLNVSESVNLGNKLVQSNIVLQVQDDDLSFVDRAEITYHILANNDIDILYCSTLQMHENNELMQGFYWAKPFDFQKHRLEGGIVGFSHIAYKKDKVPPMREGVILMSDYAFVYDAYLKGLKISHVQSPLGVYRQWIGCSSKQNDGKKEKDILLMRKIFNDPDIKTVGFGSMPKGAENETVACNTLE